MVKIKDFTIKNTFFESGADARALSLIRVTGKCSRVESVDASTGVYTRTSPVHVYTSDITKLLLGPVQRVRSHTHWSDHFDNSNLKNLLIRDSNEK